MAGQFKQAGILNASPAPPAPNRGANEARPVRAEPEPERTDPSRYRSIASNSRWRACCVVPTTNLEFRGALGAHAIRQAVGLALEMLVVPGLVSITWLFNV